MILLKWVTHKYIELLELCPCGCKEELHKKEGEYIRNTKCVNKRIAGRTPKESSKAYRQKNKDKIAKKYKEYREKIKIILLKNIKNIMRKTKISLLKKIKNTGRKIEIRLLKHRKNTGRKIEIRLTKNRENDMQKRN